MGTRPPAWFRASLAWPNALAALGAIGIEAGKAILSASAGALGLGGRDRLVTVAPAGRVVAGVLNRAVRALELAEEHGVLIV